MPPPRPSQRSVSARSWNFTVNNWTEDDLENARDLGSNDKLVVYLTVGREVAPNTGTPHLQGCVTFKKTMRRGAVSALIPRSHVSPISRTVHLAREYCAKQDPDPLIFDNREPGKRSDLELAAEMVVSGGTKQLVQENPSMFVRYAQGFERLEAKLWGPRDPSDPPKVIWLYGPTGTGKSRYVHENESNLYVAMSRAQWWEGYNQQPAILIDDFRCNFAPFNEMLRIIDRYPYRVERKGSSVHLNSARIYITSQFPPHMVYNRDKRGDEDIKQLYRRITKVVRALPQGEVPPPFSTVFCVKHGTTFVEESREQLLAADAQVSAGSSFFNV